MPSLFRASERGRGTSPKETIPCALSLKGFREGEGNDSQREDAMCLLSLGFQRSGGARLPKRQYHVPSLFRVSERGRGTAPKRGCHMPSLSLLRVSERGRGTVPDRWCHVPSLFMVS
jgi:hypothetical protein